MKTGTLASIGDITIEEIDLANLSDADILRLNAFTNALLQERIPGDPLRPVELTASSVRSIPPVVWLREFWARDTDGTIAGSGELSYQKSEENKHLVSFGINVRAEWRGRGIGKALLRLVLDAAEAEGRTLMMTGTSDRMPAGEEWAKRVGAQAGLAQHTNRLLLSDVDRSMVAQWIAEGPERATGYSLVPIDGRIPDDIVEPALEIIDVMNTAPRGDLEMEDFRLTVEQLRQWEDSMEASGDESWMLFVRHEATGRFAGFTEVLWNPGVPPIVRQLGTAVHPDHRGHAIGKWIKAAMIQRILDERPSATEIRTGNADSNAAMLSINHRLGFKPFIAETTWQIKTDVVRAYLDG